MFRPVEGRRHDAFMLSVSGLLDKLKPLGQLNGVPCVLYGDPAYELCRNIHVVSLFWGVHLTHQEQEFYQKMSAVCVSVVEWAFGKIIQYFFYLDFKKNQKVLLQPVGKYYLVEAILTCINCHTCLYGTQTSTYFSVSPPTLVTYLNNHWIISCHHQI